jgi:hypothetical protein
MAFNFPFKKLSSADLKVRGDGTGEIVLTLIGSAGTGYVPLWPHVATWHISRPRPTLLAIAEPARVSTILADAVNAWALAEGTPVAVPAHTSQPVVSVGPVHPENHPPVAAV